MKVKLIITALLFVSKYSFTQAQQLEFFEKNVFIFEEKGKYGLKDSTGKIVILPKYDYAYSTYVPYGVSRGIVNIGGKMKANNNFDGGKWGLIDKTGKEITPLKYDKIEYEFRDDVIQVAVERERYGRGFYIDKNGNEVKE